MKTHLQATDTIIRPATRADYAAIAALIDGPQELFLVFPRGHWPFDVRQVHRLAEQRLDLTVCVSGGEVTGFANIYDKRPGQAAFIGNFIVGRAARGRGIGARLLSYMLVQIFERYNLPQARISVFSYNRPALKLYEKAGFVRYAEESRTAPDGQRVTLWHLKLDRDDQK